MRSDRASSRILSISSQRSLGDTLRLSSGSLKTPSHSRDERTRDFRPCQDGKRPGSCCSIRA